MLTRLRFKADNLYWSLRNYVLYNTYTPCRHRYWVLLDDKPEYLLTGFLMECTICGVKQ